MNGVMTKFERGVLNLPSFEAFAEQTRKSMPSHDISDAEMRMQYGKLQSDEVWINDQYQVNIDRNPPHGFPETEMWHLSIKRRDKDVVHDWRDLQTIKNMLVSPLAEAMELYPSEERMVDTVNQYHLWVFVRMGDKRFPTIPAGWVTGAVGDNEQAGKTGARQRDRT